jgi:hypothetical protein
MRQPLIVQGAPSPLAQTFAQMAQTILSQNPEDRDYKRAMIQKMTTDANAKAQQQQALGGVKDNLATLFGKYTAEGTPVVPWQNPDTGEVIQNTQPSAPLATPEQLNQIRSTGLADLYARVGKDNADAITQGLATGAAYGSPDEMRRSMVLQGKAINQDFSPTVAEADRIAGRNSSLAQQRDLAKINATPLSDSQVKGGLLKQNWDNLQNLPIEQKKALGALPNKGMSVTYGPNGEVNVNYGGNDTGAATSLSKPNIDRQQQNLQVNQEARTLIDSIQKDIKTNPNAVGPVGNIVRGAQNTADIYQSLVGQFGSPEALEGQIKAAENFAKQNNISLDFNPALPRVVRANNMLIMKAAAAIANQSGRNLSDKDVQFVKNIVGDPTSWTEGPKGYSAGLEQLSTIIDDNIKNSSGALQSGQVQLGNPVGTPAAPSAAPTGAPAVNVIEQSIENARAAIKAGKSPEHVKQRLRQKGITPPPDL